MMIPEIAKLRIMLVASIHIGNKSDLKDLTIDEQPCSVFDNLEQAVPLLEKPWLFLALLLESVLPLKEQIYPLIILEKIGLS